MVDSPTSRKPVRAHVIFYGLVQGVFFRANTRAFAREVGVTGWVKNLPDGSVEALFEGERERVDEVIRRSREEQPYARVTGAEITWEEPTGEWDSFEIVY